MSPPWPFWFDARDWVAVADTMASARRTAAATVRLMTSTSFIGGGRRDIRQVAPIPPIYVLRAGYPSPGSSGLPSTV
jgi:hypothetical protein